MADVLDVPVAPQEIVLGIDFGTSYSTAAAFVEGQVQYVMDSGDPAIPSLAYVPASGPPVVGRDAMRLGFSDPFGLVSSVKRILGRPWGDPGLRAIDAGSHFSLAPAPNGGLVMRLNGHDLTPVQLVAQILMRLKKLAEQRFGGVARKAVFTVPAEKPPGYAAALALAAKMAGLETIDQVPEPVAGFVSNGLDRTGDRRVAVLDFGGGTFDATLMEQRGQKFSSKAIGGDTFLGGDDFDHTLADAVDGAVSGLRKRSIHTDVVKWRQLLYRCESVKRQLSSVPKARLQLKDADIDVVVERAWIEPRWATLVERAADVVERLLKATGWRAGDIDEVLMIGGTTMAPIVAKVFSQLFARKIAGSPEATLAVARGAALLAARRAAIA